MKLKILIAVFLISILTKISFAAEPYNFANLWQAWSVAAREAYLDGMVDGIAEAYWVTRSNLAPNKTEKETKVTTERLFVRYTRNQLREVISDLYKDPANSYITTSDMFFLARDKIEGKNIEKGIMEARSAAIENHRINETRRLSSN